MSRIHPTPVLVRQALMISKLLLGFVVASAFLAGCATRVEVVPIDKSQFVSKGASSPAMRQWWCEDSLRQKLVHRYNLERLIREDPERALSKLNDVVSRAQQAEDIAALAGLTLRYGRKLEHTEPQKSLGLYLAAAAIGYDHLIQQNKSSSTNHWDLRIRESYNQATSGVVISLQRLPSGVRTNHLVSSCGRSFRVEALSGDSTCDFLDYDRWLSADHWRLTGFNARYWNDGLGARLIQTGTIRDVMQNHLFQVLANLTMEPPVRTDSESIRDEKVKVLKAILPLEAKNLVRGQFRGYRNEPGVATDSITETFAAFKLEINSWRWRGVPFYFWVGKCLPVTCTEIIVQLRQPPTMYEGFNLKENHCRLRISPEVAFAFRMNSIDADDESLHQPVEIAWGRCPHAGEMDAYERVLGDAMAGDATLFAREDYVEEAWRIVDPVLKAGTPVFEYNPKTWGPTEVENVTPSGSWHNPVLNGC